MDQPLCKLTLIYPIDAEDKIVESLLSADPPMPGFTTFPAEGHGLDFSSASASERVRGRVRRGVLMVVLPRARLAGLLDLIARDAPVLRLMHWVEPVESCGRLVLDADDGAPPPAIGSD